MVRTRRDGLLALCALFCLLSLAFGAEDSSAQPGENSLTWLERDTLTNNWLGFGGTLEEAGFALALGLTQVYQHNASGGLNAGYGDYSMSWDLEVEADLEKLIGLPGGLLYSLAEGSYGRGIDGAVGGLSGVNDDAAGEVEIAVTELWYEQSLWRDFVTWRVGKIDLTGGFECAGCPVAFDGNRFANDETSDFLNSWFINNPSIPFPDNGLGAVLMLAPVEWYYVSCGGGDALANANASGLDTTFDGDGRFFCVVETGLLPNIPSRIGGLQGAYRFGVWFDDQAKEYLDETGERDTDIGYYVSACQTVWHESPGPESGQGLGLFGRLGWADKKLNEIEFFWSGGASYTGPIPGRDADVLAVGFSRGELSDRSPDFSASHEQVVECFYNAALTSWLHVTADLQWIDHPGGDDSLDDAWVAGVRGQLTF